MFLRVEDYAGDPPGIAQGIVREIIKAVCLGFFFGTIWALAGLVSRKETFYDQWLDLRVEDLRPGRPDPDPEELPQVHAQAGAEAETLSDWLC